MKKPVTGNKNEVKKLLRRMDSGTEKEIARDARIIQRAQKMFDAGNKAELKGLKRTDGWMNFFTGLNVQGKDKRTGGRVVWQPMEEVIAEQLYGGDKMARRLVELLPNEMMREWITLKGFDPQVQKNIIKEMDRLQIKKRFWQGLVFSRLYGGAGTLVNVDDGEPDLIQPLDLKRVKAIKSLWTFGRFELEVLASDVEYDLDNENFGQPNLYMLVPRNRTDQSIQMQRQIVKFHHSRIIRWDGQQLPRRIEITNRYWGDSVLSPFVDILRDHKQAVGTLAHILMDFRVALVKIKGLADLIASGQESKLQTRIDLMDLSRSVLGSILLDADEEDFEYKTTTLTGVDLIIDALKKDMTASQDAPHNVLFNESPAGGLNGAGEANMRQWYDFIHSQQEERLRPNLLRFFEILFANESLYGTPPEDWTIIFNSLWQQTDEEIADTRFKTAQADDLYIGNGTLSPQEIRQSRFGLDEYSAETLLDENLNADPEAKPDEIRKAELPSNLDPQTKMNVPADAGTKGGQIISPEAIAANATAKMRSATETIDRNTGKPKDEKYVDNLYNSFVQDGKKIYRMDGAPRELLEILVQPSASLELDYARKIAGVFGKSDGVTSTKYGYSFLQVPMPKFTPDDIMVKEPMMGVRLYFGKLKKARA